MSGSHLCIPRNETVKPPYFQNRIIMFCLPNPTLIYLWEIYIFPGSVCLFCCRKYVDRSWEYINCPQSHECGGGEDGKPWPHPQRHSLSQPWRWYPLQIMQRRLCTGLLVHSSCTRYNPSLDAWLLETSESNVKAAIVVRASSLVMGKDDILSVMLTSPSLHLFGFNFNPL